MGIPFRQQDSRALIAEGGSFKDGCVEDANKTTTADGNAKVLWSSRAIAVDEVIAVRAMVVGKLAGSTAAAGNPCLVGTFRRQAAGNVTLVGALTGTTQEDSAGTPVITLAANTTAQTVELRVTGIAAENWSWECKVESLAI